MMIVVSPALKFPPRSPQILSCWGWRDFSRPFSTPHIHSFGFRGCPVLVMAYIAAAVLPPTTSLLVAARLTSGCVKGWLGSKKAYGGRKRGLEVGLEG
jgi:hypothetical protein